MKKHLTILVLLTLIPVILAISLLYQKKCKDDKVEPKGQKPNPGICEHPHGIDISHHNNAYDWSKVDCQFVYIRATMGSNVKDKRYYTHRDSALSYKIPMGAYHFLTAKTSAKIQFDNFRSVVSPDHIQLRPMLDVEESDYWKAPKGFNDTDAHRLIRTWCNLCKEVYGIAPIIYTGKAERV